MTDSLHLEESHQAATDKDKTRPSNSHQPSSLLHQPSSERRSRSRQQVFLAVVLLRVSLAVTLRQVSIAVSTSFKVSVMRPNTGLWSWMRGTFEASTSLWSSLDIVVVGEWVARWAYTSRTNKLHAIPPVEGLMGAGRASTAPQTVLTRTTS